MALQKKVVVIDSRKGPETSERSLRQRNRPATKSSLYEKTFANAGIFHRLSEMSAANSEYRYGCTIVSLVTEATGVPSGNGYFTRFISRAQGEHRIIIIGSLK